MSRCVRAASVAWMASAVLASGIVAACATSTTPTVTVVVQAVERPGVAVAASQVLGVKGLNPKQCKEWELAPTSQGGGVVEFHVTTTESRSHRVAADARGLPGVIKVSIAPAAAFGSRQLPSAVTGVQPIEFSACQ